MLKQRTGLTPNLLCRIALMMSLEEGPLGNIPLPNEDGSEFNAYTLTGENTDLFLSLLRYVEDHQEEPLENKILLDRMRGHIHRGIGSLSVRAKSPLNILQLIS
ncbi:DNA sulfur modification protein DndE [Acinetobacter sp. XH1639]|uniref:DNA sulfur modification protein DndE n=1 Tax=Acinetobacter sp. XH1639 TaxID=3157368 RepID=UPI0032B47F21